MALAEAGVRNGVRRILPSDYALDLFEVTPGEHPLFDQRVEADRRIAVLDIGHVHVLQGAFMMMVADGFSMFPGAAAAGLPVVDHEAGVASFYGTGDGRIDVTSVEDTARMIVRVALDADVPSGKFAFRGDSVSWNEAIVHRVRLDGALDRVAVLGGGYELELSCTTTGWEPFVEFDERRAGAAARGRPVDRRGGAGVRVLVAGAPDHALRAGLRDHSRPLAQRWAPRWAP